MSVAETVRETLADAQALRAKMFRLRFPFVAELGRYSAAKFRADLIAGATLTLVSIPQAIGFSLILNLPPVPVIVSVIVGGFFGALFFSSHHHVFGPTSSISLITAATIASYTGPSLPPLQLAILLALMIGTIQLVAGLLNFGEVTKFISRSVVVGYSTGIGVLLVASQLHNLLGFRVELGQSFLLNLWQAATLLLEQKISLWALGIGLGTLVIFEGVRRLRPNWPEALIGLAVMGGAAKVAALFHPRLPFALVQDEGALSAVLPSFAGLHWGPAELQALPWLTSTAVAISILGMLEAVSITKSLAARSGQKIEPNQELAGMGVANIACGLFGAVPGSSSFARSAVNFQSGAATQLSSMLSSVVVLGVLLFVTPVFDYIPVAALAAHLIRVGGRMINWHQIRVACRSTRSDAAVFAVTLGACLLLKLDTAIYVGIGVALALALQKTSTPLLVEYTFNESGNLAELTDPARRAHPSISIIHVEGELFFGAADLFQEQVRYVAEDDNIRVFVLRMKNARHLDASAVMALENLHDYLQKTGRHLLISGVNAEVERVVRNSGLLKLIGSENVFPAESNPTISTKRALVRATLLLQTRRAGVRLFYGRQHEKVRDAATPAGAPPRPEDYEI
ncbi:MAG: SulP family inorganic anion transporter [Opitutaceae bacterium]|nr:SulP family inorganic anion transporter [Opitutaceae bacterium]